MEKPSSDLPGKPGGTIGVALLWVGTTGVECGETLVAGGCGCKGVGGVLLRHRLPKPIFFDNLRLKGAIMQKTALPTFLKQGSRARLIPVLADTSKENRATSVFLSCLMAVDDFGSRLLGTVGQRVGTRAKIQCFTEVVLEKALKKKDRPDGLIILEVGKRRWTALIEAKIGLSELDAEQLERYLEIAKINKIDAVITISNQLAALPTHHPVKIAKSKLRGRKLFHWSWMHVLTQAVLLLDTENTLDRDQRFILEEMVRYFRHDSSGIRQLGRMNAEWNDLALSVKNGAQLAKTSDEVVNAIAAWHQLQRDLCLILTRKLATPVSLRLTHAHKLNPESRLRDDCQQLAQKVSLRATLEVPDAAAPLNITADLLRRTITCSMRVNAPEDKKS
ncbi:MAG: hypothetical protein IID51_14320, partial [Proteobacteria bacterium]|nr:hypothetical protein [Pseudomonadota bacterium]